MSTDRQQHRYPCVNGNVCGEAAHCPPPSSTGATPRRIEYSGPEGWTVWGDEDGVHVRTPKGDGLESCDLTALISLVTEVRGQFYSATIPVPAPPTPERRRQMYGEQREEYDAKRASRAVYAALAPSPNVPF